MKIRKRFTLAVAALAALGLVAGCGDGDSSEEHEASVTPAKAIAEIALVRQGLAAGLAAYQQGNPEKADQLVGTAYLEHFELVEVPLEERDEELTEELEELIREEIRAEINADAKVAEISALVAEANRELTEAEKTLQK